MLLGSALTIAAATGLAQPVRVAAQTSGCTDYAPRAFQPCALAAAKKFDPPRTAAGHPDFNGVWRHRVRGGYEDLEAHPETRDDNGGPGMVVDPADGTVPMQAWADAARKENPKHYIHHNAACFLSGVPETMYMSGTFEFVQTADDLVVLAGDTHAYRSIPLDGRAHIGDAIHLWNGDSVGHWEGDTLVIDTTNQNGLPWLDQRGRFYTRDAHVVERLMFVDADTLYYEATIDDPNVYTRPFKIVLPYTRNTDPDYEMLAEACYENNAEVLQVFREVGFGIYPGVTPEQAQALGKAQQ